MSLRLWCLTGAKMPGHQTDPPATTANSCYGLGAQAVCRRIYIVHYSRPPIALHSSDSSASLCASLENAQGQRPITACFFTADQPTTTSTSPSCDIAGGFHATPRELMELHVHFAIIGNDTRGPGEVPRAKSINTPELAGPCSHGIPCPGKPASPWALVRSSFFSSVGDDNKLRYPQHFLEPDELTIETSRPHRLGSGSRPLRSPILLGSVATPPVLYHILFYFSWLLPSDGSGSPAPLTDDVGFSCFSCSSYLYREGVFVGL
ncbi:hypothetical protein EV126DRAFT_409434, partial [Verticillium dahliae]